MEIMHFVPDKDDGLMSVRPGPPVEKGGRPIWGGRADPVEG
ncbi:MAG: hypothetical protein ACXACE_10490 [Candidatus Thorarchaeota archaeon]